MKKVLMLALGLTLCAGVAMADHIGLYGELAGLTCNKAFVGAGALNSVFVLQRFNTGSAASEYMVQNQGNAPYDSESLGNAAYLSIGQALTGISVSYNSCIITGDIFVERIRFSDDWGPAPATCSKLVVVPDPNAVPPVLQTLDCQGFPEAATGGTFYWGVGCGQCGEVATAPTTWGSVKALYR